MQDEKIAENFYDAGTIAFYYIVLNYLYSAYYIFCWVEGDNSYPLCSISSNTKLQSIC